MTHMTASWIKALIALPFNATVTIPAIILYLTGNFSICNNVPVFLAGLFILFLGMFLAIWTMVLNAKIGKGTLAPWSPTKKLVVEGPYRHVRNPMLSGVIMVILGEAVVFSSWGIFLWGVIFFVINTFYFIFSEEVGLEKRFGEEYVLYKKNVPRWIPRIRAWKK